MTVAHPQLAAVPPCQISIINKASNATIANVLFPSLFKIKNFHKHHKGLTHKREKTFNCPSHFHSKESKKKKTNPQIPPKYTRGDQISPCSPHRPESTGADSTFETRARGRAEEPKRERETAYF